MNHPGHPTLAGAALSGEEDGGPLALGQQPDLVGEVLHARGVAQRIEPVVRRGLELECLVDPAEPGLVGDPGRGRGQVLHVHRLGQEVLGAELHGPDGGRDVGLAGEQDDGRVPLPHALQHLHPIHSGQAEVEDHDLRPEPVEGGESGLAAQLPRDLVAEPLEVVPDAAQHVHIVVDEKHRTGHASPRDRAEKACHSERIGAGRPGRQRVQLRLPTRN